MCISPLRVFPPFLSITLCLSFVLTHKPEPPLLKSSSMCYPYHLCLLCFSYLPSPSTPFTFLLAPSNFPAGLLWNIPVGKFRSMYPRARGPLDARQKGVAPCQRSGPTCVIQGKGGVWQVNKKREMFQIEEEEIKDQNKGNNVLQIDGWMDE